MSPPTDSALEVSRPPSRLPRPGAGASREDPVARARAALASSDLLRAVASVRRDGGLSFAFGEGRVRPLRREEIDRLEAHGNTCPDWSRVRVVDGFDWRTVRQCSLYGDVVLGRFGGPVQAAPGVTLPGGVYQSTVADCVLGDGVLVRDVRLLANYVVGEGAVLLDCGAVTSAPGTAFGNGAVLPLGVETGGRDVAVYAEIDVETAAAVARSRHRPGLLRSYAEAVAEYAARAASPRGIIGPKAAIRGSPKVQSVYVGPHARIDGATCVAESTLLSDPDHPVEVGGGASVTRSLLQWGSRVGTMAVVERAVLAEHAHAERHAKVTDSIIGCNSGVAAGEVTATLLGPFVNFHHQALLIAALWPEGKGNVGYGANVGSNHTGKAPDQEFLPGEGLFLGLGVNVKYPADFSRSPYTVVASGVTTLPQKLALPFSLVNLPAARHPDISPAYNEVIPAWVLAENLYALKRNEDKYRARNRARRTRLETEVLRPEIVVLMQDAVRRLEGVGRPREVYTDRDVEGLGKNYLLERHRAAAVEAYRFFIQYYALLGLKGRLETLFAERRPFPPGRLLSTPTDEHPWEHQRRILYDDLGHGEAASALRLLPGLLRTVAQGVERSKAKDDERGPAIIPDYAAAHVPAALDPVVRQAWEAADTLGREVEELLSRLQPQGEVRVPADRRTEPGGLHFLRPADPSANPPPFAVPS